MCYVYVALDHDIFYYALLHCILLYSIIIGCYVCNVLLYFNIIRDGMVEKWNLILGPSNLQDLGTPKTSVTPWIPQDLKTLEPRGASEPQYPWEIPSTVWTSQPKHQSETLKDILKLYNWTITNQIKKLLGPFWGFFIYRVVNDDY